MPLIATPVQVLEAIGRCETLGTVREKFLCDLHDVYDAGVRLQAADLIDDDWNWTPKGRAALEAAQAGA